MNNKKFNKLKDIIYNKVLDLYPFLNRKEFFKLTKRMNIDNIRIQREGELLKFRRWEPNWELPKEINIKEETIKYGSSRKNQDIIKRTLWAKIEKLENFQRRWSSNKTPRYWGNQAKIPYQIIKSDVWCKIHDNWFFTGIIPKPKEFIYNNKWLYYRIPTGYLGISYISSDYHSHFILLPSSIKADNFFFEGLGLQQGDGTQSLSDVHVTFTNACEDLIYHQIEWFKRLGISKKALRILPEIPTSLNIEKEVLKWKTALKVSGIKEYQFRKAKINNRNLKNSLVQILFHNKLFKAVYLHLLYNLRKEIIKEKSECINYIKGILASEGSVKVRKDSRLLSAIKISASREDTRDFYKNCLLNLGIIPSKDELTKGSEAVMITKLKNYKKILEMNLLSLHPKKQERFINTLKNYQTIRKGGVN